MKISFYGNTLKAAEGKASSFVQTLQRNGEKLIGKKVNISSINQETFEDPHCVVKAYRFCARVEYNLSPK